MPRNADIVKAYKKGASLREIGETHGLTAERVRQILLKEGIERRGPGSLTTSDYEAFVIRHGQQVNRHFDRTKSIRQTVAHFEGEYPKSWTQRLLADRASEQRLDLRTPRPVMYNDEALLDALRSKATDGVLSAKAYQDQRTPADPSMTTIILRFGSWSTAIKRAGLRGGKRHSAPTRKWTHDQMLDAVRAYVADCERTGTTPTVLGYGHWRQAHPNSPSFPTIRIHTNQRWLSLIEATRSRPTTTERSSR